MTNRERFHAVMNFQPFDRLPLIEWAIWWDETLDRWFDEGLPQGDQADIFRYFGLDDHRQDWFRSLRNTAPVPEHDGAGLISNEDDYEALKPHLYPLDDDWPVKREQWQSWAEDQARGDSIIWITLEGFFWFPRVLFGIEPHFYAFYDQPDLMHRINRENAAWMLRIIDRVCDYCVPDFMTFAEDMSYNHGAMLSKELFDEFMRPYYDMVVPVLRERGIHTIIDSDGDVTVPIDWFDEAGLEGVLPLERQAGVDLAAIRQKHPRMRFIGHYDKMVMHRGEKAMRQEFERLLPVAAQGGFIPSCDHQTPPAVSVEDYKLYMKLFREYAAEAGRLSQTLNQTSTP